MAGRFLSRPTTVVLVLSLLIPLAAVLYSPVSTMNNLGLLSSVFTNMSRKFFSTPSTTAPPVKRSRTPVYFFSHGGPDVQYNTKHPVYPVLQSIGREITEKVKPKAVIVISAHWQGDRDTIHVNSAEKTDLIYDFGGFPKHYYEATYPNTGSPALASRIRTLLSASGIASKPTTTRGLDHGVWSGFAVAFSPTSNPLRVPLVQVSLYRSEDPAAHLALGAALSPLRDEGVVVIGTGMSVHNLHDVSWAVDGSGPETGARPMPYAVSFDEAVRSAVEDGETSEERGQRLKALVKRADARQAHPYMDHLMPLHVVAGAAGEDRGKRLWTTQEGSFAWAQFRFGEVE